MHRLTWILAALVLWNGATFATAQENWPEFRGPTGQGHATSADLPVEWSDTKNVVWKEPIPGHGWSSPAIVDGRIYLTTAVPVGGDSKDLSLRALCLEAATGKVQWNVEVFLQSGEKAPKIHNKNSHASPSPLVYDGRVYVHFGHQGTAALDRNGKILWSNRDLKYEPVHGNGGTPARVGGVLAFSCDGASDPFVVALDEQTGTVRWKTGRETKAPKKFSFSSPLVIDVNGKPQVISPGSNHVGGFDAATGREIWRVQYQGYSVIPRPVYGHGLLFIGTGYDSPTVMAIRPDGQGDVTESHVAWTIKKAAPHTPSLLLVGEELYMVSDRGVATCVDAKTGQEVWQERLGGNFSASPMFAAGRVYFPSEEGKTTVVKAGREYHVLATNTLPERIFASFAVSGKALFIRTEGHLYRLENR